MRGRLFTPMIQRYFASSDFFLESENKYISISQSIFFKFIFTIQIISLCRGRNIILFYQIFIYFFLSFFYGLL